jgi:hypothetical protein
MTNQAWLTMRLAPASGIPARLWGYGRATLPPPTPLATRAAAGADAVEILDRQSREICRLHMELIRLVPSIPDCWPAL